MVIILSGSSASGKNTLIKEILKTNNEIKYINTFTSRTMREDESEGNPYHFITKDEFQAKIKNGDFFEHELIHNNFYGVDKNICLSYLDQNLDIIKDMGIYGTFNLKEKLQDRTNVRTIFLFVDKKTLRKRLIHRGEKQIKLRLKRYRLEQKHANKYDFLIYNKDIEKTLTILHKIISYKDQPDYMFIKPICNRINEKKVKKYCDQFLKNKEFKPIKIYFNGENFYIKHNVEKYIASILSKKCVTKNIITKNANFKVSNENLIIDYINDKLQNEND